MIVNSVTSFEHIFLSFFSRLENVENYYFINQLFKSTLLCQLTCNTANEWISTHSWWTRTACLMVLASTNGSWSTSDGVTHLEADAVESVADFIRSAIVMTLTTNRNTSHRGVALHSRWAVALGSMQDNATERVGSTLFRTAKHTRVQTFASYAGSIRWTIFINFALS